MHCIAAISLLLNVLEIFHLGIRKIRRAFYEKSGNEGIDDERAPPFHLRKYSVPQQDVTCSPLSERTSLLQANNQQQVIQVSVPKSKTLWQIPQPKPLEIDPWGSKKDWAEKGQHSGQLHVHSPCPWDDCARVQHPGQQPDPSSFAIQTTMSQNWLGTMMPPRHCPSYAIGTWGQSQDWQRSGEPLRFAQSLQRQRWQREREWSLDRDLARAVARAAFCPGCYLKRDSCTVTQVASVLGLARAFCISKTAPCSAFSHWAQNINGK